MVMEERWKNNIMLSENNNIMSLSENDNYLYLIVSFWYASAAYQASLGEPWFVCMHCLSPSNNLSTVTINQLFLLEAFSLGINYSVTVKGNVAS